MGTNFRLVKSPQLNGDIHKLGFYQYNIDMFLVTMPRQTDLCVLEFMQLCRIAKRDDSMRELGQCVLCHKFEKWKFIAHWFHSLRIEFL